MKKLINPIANFDEKVLLAVGLASVAVAIIGGYILGYKFDAIFHMTYAKQDWREVGGTTLRSYGIAIAAFFLLGLIVNRKTRFVDIFNTVLIANIPVVFLSLLQSIPFVSNATKEVMKSPQDLSPAALSFLFLSTLIAVPLLVLCFVILYNGFRTSTNLKQWYHVALFIVVALSVSFTQFLR
jgi:hypothetical protein